jgi:hypothetical protein
MARWANGPRTVRGERLTTGAADQTRGISFLDIRPVQVRQSKLSATRSARTDFWIAERPHWRCQRWISRAGVLPWTSATSVIARSLKVMVLAAVPPQLRQ